MTVRPYREEDREQALSFLRGDTRSLDDPNQYVHVAEEDSVIVGVSIGVVPDVASSEETEATLGNILLADASRMDVFHRLMLAKVEHAVELGFEYGYTVTRRRNLVEIGEQVYGVEAEPSGWLPNSDVAVEWTFRAHLPTFLQQLRAMTPPPARPAGGDVAPHGGGA